MFSTHFNRFRLMRRPPRRIKLLLLGAATAATAAGGLTLAAAPAFAQSPTVLAFGGPQEVYVSGTGFNYWGPSDTVRVTVLTADLRTDLGQEGNYGSYTGVKISNGNLTAAFDDLGYTGPVQIFVDDMTTDQTWGAQATTTPELQFTAVSQKGCGPEGTYGNYVTATARNFLNGYTATFQLYSENLTPVGGPITVNAVNGVATVPPQQMWTYNLSGPAYVLVNETGYGPTAGLPAPYGNIGAGAMAWDVINLCS